MVKITRSQPGSTTNILVPFLWPLEEQIGFLLDELFDEQNLEALARHPFANFVVQHIFEHGMAERKSRCFEMLLPHVLQHATHKTASNLFADKKVQTDTQEDRFVVVHHHKSIH